MYDPQVENLLKEGKSIIQESFDDVERIFHGGYNGSDEDQALLRSVFGYVYLDAIKAKVEAEELNELFGEDSE